MCEPVGICTRAGVVWLVGAPSTKISAPLGVEFNLGPGDVNLCLFFQLHVQRSLNVVLYLDVPGVRFIARDA